MQRYAQAAATAAIIGTVLCAWAALHEYTYWSDHPGRTGVSGILAVFALGAALIGAAVTLLAISAARQR